MRGRVAAKLFDVPQIEGRSYWLAGDAPFFQLEFFALSEPCVQTMRPAPINAPGYNLITFAVDDLDKTLLRLRERGIAPHASMTAADGSRHICLRDPENVLVELIERPGRSARVLGVGMTVADPDDALRYFTAGFGLSQYPCQTKVREQLWGVGQPARSIVRFMAGDYWIEVRHYQDGGDTDPQIFSLVKPGLANIALGFSKAVDFTHCFERVTQAGFHPALPPISFMGGHNAYLRSEQRISVELLQLPRHTHGVWGFRKPGIVSRLIQYRINKKLLMQPI